MRRLRVRPSQPNLRGPRESPPGPTTWVRPATGWWERMNAGRKTLRNQGCTVWAPLSVSRRRSRGLRKTPRWSADRRAGPRHGPAVPFRRRDGLCRKASHRVRRSAPALVGASPPSDGGKSPKAAGRTLPRNDGDWLSMMSLDQQTACHAPRKRGIQHSPTSAIAGSPACGAMTAEN